MKCSARAEFIREMRWPAEKWPRVSLVGRPVRRYISVQIGLADAGWRAACAHSPPEYVGWGIDAGLLRTVPAAGRAAPLAAAVRVDCTIACGLGRAVSMN
jgi:hypothetical protein